LNSVNRGFSSFSTAGQILSINNKLECSGGLAGGQFPCNEIDLMSFMDKTQIGGSNSTSLNDIWGWTDPQTNKEYALVGMSNGTSFVDISDAENPVFVGRLATQTNNSTWRDIKVYQNHAFIVSEAGGHGMQVFDLKELRNYSGSPITFSNTAFYSEFGNAHNIFINEDTGYAYAVGTSTCGPGGLHIVDISTPSIPSKAACVSDPNVGNERGGVGYNHDVQCVIYNGPDSAYVGKEICFGSTENSVWIADLSTKSDDSTGQKTIGIGTYDDYYTHQGWLTEDHKYFIANDELDENNNAYSNTRTLIWNVEDLSNPTLENTYLGPTPAIDHNNYIIGDKVYMSHYTSGLRVLDISDISSPTEDSFFDVYPSNNNTSFDGTWSNYPYYPSGVIVVSGIDEGLFVLNPSGNEQGQAPTVTYAVPSDGSVTLTWDLIGNSSTKMNIYRAEEEGFTPSSSNLLVSVNYPGVEYTDSSLDSNTFYYYQLSLETNGTVGPFSDEIKVKPIVAPNQPPTIDQPANIEFFEDNQYSLTLTGVGYGSDVNPQNVTISAISDNTDLFSAIEVVESLPQQLALNPLENQYGSATITVTVKDDGGVEGGGVDTTTVTFTATVNPVNDPPSSFNSIGEYLLGSGQYIPGTDFRTLYITPENVNDSIRFVWDPASDVDGDNVQYRMIGYQGLEFLSMTAYTSDSFKTWALKDLVAETDTISVTEGSWNVIATDGQSFNTAIAIGGQLRVDGRQLIPDVLEIKQSYPNPFTTFTTIEYDVPSTQNVVLKIFNIRGQIVKTLVNEDKSPGYYSVVWDGTNDSGDAVSSGVYFCQMHTPKNPNGGQFIKAKKMVKIR
jgi:choice-of-anchor B domain-containing protein